MMNDYTERLTQLVEKKAQIEQRKKDHPEMAEAMQLVEDYYASLQELSQQMAGVVPVPVPTIAPDPIPIPVPYPGRPLTPDPYAPPTSITITCGTNTSDRE